MLRDRKPSQTCLITLKVFTIEFAGTVILTKRVRLRSSNFKPEVDLCLRKRVTSSSCEQINELYSRLLQDKRHHTVAMLEYAEIDERKWAQWSMGFAAPSADNRALFLKYSGQSVFNPYGMRGYAVKKMLGELAGKSITMHPPIERGDGASAAVKPAMSVAAPAPFSSSAPRQTTESGFLGRLLNR